MLISILVGFFPCGCEPPDSSIGAFAVLFIMWERTSVTSGPVYAQGDWSPWQRVSGDLQTSDLSPLSPSNLQPESQRQYHHLPQAR